tara:strand:- start:3894 stop:5186 length:1293 start_codon:yes stop_codon:yes gene_type:complete
MMGLFSRLLRRRRLNPRRTGLFGGVAGLRDRMPRRRNMFFGGRRQMNPFLGMNNLPRISFLPPSIAEAQGRNLSNVGLLPSYMQPGGSGMPETDNRFADMPQPPEMQTSDMTIYTDAFGNQKSGSSSMARYHKQLKEYFAANPGAQDYYLSQNPPSKMPPVSPPFGDPIRTPGLLKLNPGPALGGVNRIGDIYANRENFVAAPNKDPNDSSFGPGDPGYRPGVPDPLKGQPISPTLPMDLPPMPDPIVDMQGRMGFENGGDADKSDFPDLSGDGKITKKDILIGRGVIEMGNGGDPADEQARALMSEEDRMMANMSIPGKDMPSGSDSDMMNYQRALQNYQEFYYSQPEALRANLPSPAELYNEPEKVMNDPAYRDLMGEAGRGLGSALMMGSGPGRGINQISMLLKQLDGPSMPNFPEKKSPNFPMMSR